MTNKRQPSETESLGRDNGNVEDTPPTPADGAVNWSGGDCDGQSTERTTGANISWGQSTEITSTEQAQPGASDNKNAHGDDGDDAFPFYPFPNLFIYLAFAGLFLYLATGIITEYIESLRSPPAVVDFLTDNTQLLPGFVLCNYDFSVPLSGYVYTTLLSQQMDKNYNDTYFGTDGTRSESPVLYERHLECPGFGTIKSCLVFDVPLPAFVETEFCQERIQLKIALELNTSAYTPYTIGMGTTGYLFDTAPYADIGGIPQEVLCAEQALASCAGTGSDSDADSNGCNLPRQTEVSAPAGSITIMKLTRAETKNTKCDKYETTWTTSPNSAKLNPSFLDMFGLGNGAEEYAVLALELSTSTFRRISYRPISWKAMFGSVAGWFGALSDGWGIITLVLMLQGTYLRRQQLSQTAINIAKHPVESVRCLGPSKMRK